MVRCASRATRSTSPVRARRRAMAPAARGPWRGPTEGLGRDAFVLVGLLVMMIVAVAIRDRLRSGRRASSPPTRAPAGGAPPGRGRLRRRSLLPSRSRRSAGLGPRAATGALSGLRGFRGRRRWRRGACWCCRRRGVNSSAPAPRSARQRGCLATGQGPGKHSFAHEVAQAIGGHRGDHRGAQGRRGVEGSGRWHALPKLERD